MTRPALRSHLDESNASLPNIDAVQWRVLHAMMFKNNFRAANALYRGTGKKARKRAKKPRNALWVLVGYGFVGFYCAMVLATSPTPILGVFAVLSVMTVMSLIGLIVESPNSLYSMKDYEALAFMPANVRTYMASKISAAMAYNSVLCALVAAPSFLVLAIRDGLVASLGWIIASTTCMVFICLAVMTLFSALVRSVTPDKLRNITTAFQLLGLTCIMGLFLFFMPGTSDTIWDSSSLNLVDNRMLLLFPPYWFLALYLLVEGHVNTTVLVGSTFAILGGVSCFWYLWFRASSRFFEKLSESFVGSSGETRNPTFWSVRLSRIAESLSAETYAVWKLVVSHVKYDQVLRNVVGSVPPLMIFYLAIPIYQGMMGDPFVDKEAIWNMGLVYFAVLFASTMTLDICRISQSYRASWLLFVSPVSLARFSLAITDCVASLVALPFLVLLAISFCFFFESPINAIMHTVTLAWATYAMLQLKAIVNPVLPFTEYFNNARFMGGMVLSIIILGVSMFVVLFMMAEWVYRTSVSYYVSIIVGPLLCYALRRAAHGLCVRRFRKLEFAG